MRYNIEHIFYSNNGSWYAIQVKMPFLDFHLTDLAQLPKFHEKIPLKFVGPKGSDIRVTRLLYHGLIGET